MKKLGAYNRVKGKALADLKEESASKVKECYKLVRNFCLTYNWINNKSNEKRESMLYIPAVFEDDFKKLLSEEVLTKFITVMKVPFHEIDKNLPAEFNDAQVKKVIAFIDEKDKDVIIGKLEKDISKFTSELEVPKKPSSVPEE